MSQALDSKSDGTGSHQPFGLTQWTIVLKARDEKTPGAQEAMEELCRAYWAPLYHFIRREGYRRHDAQDLTQAFYHHFYEKHLLHRVTERRGKFRSFLLTCLKYFLCDQRDRAKALKRGGGQSFVSLDAFEAEERDAVEPTNGLTADRLYERRWARALLDRVEQRLRQEYVIDGRQALYQALAELPQGGKTEAGYSSLACQLGMSEAAVKSAAHRLRLRHQRVLREEIGRTVGGREEVEEEIRYMIRALGN
ncbi:MAG TPA: sigma-70 family RNA polymerase sigma factor [Verrucomicrobiae bacterium]|nr:sigma-70 family RNA polymerase sigma factor [Verrucomicrobiae bacterium]